MSVRIIRTLVLSLALVFVAAPLASAKGDGHGPIARILKHATELGLTPDQIKQLEALRTQTHAKTKEGHKELRAEIKAILTADQIAKIKQYKEEHQKTK